jgi:hypothetical protein
VEAVAAVFDCRGHQRVGVQIRSNRIVHTFELMGRRREVEVEHECIRRRIDRDRLHAKSVGGFRNSYGDFAPVGYQDSAVRVHRQGNLLVLRMTVRSRADFE